MDLVARAIAWGKLHCRRIGRIIAVVVACFCLLIAGNYLWIGRYSTYVLSDQNRLSEVLGSKRIGVVFGGGIENGKPRPLLRERLDTAARLVQDGTVQTLIVSGDNRFVDYNEPQAMKQYLVEQKQLDPSVVQLDNAGRSTYETCERAAKIFSLTRAVFISESTHLPRAIYTCRSFGIEAYGYSSDGQALAGLQASQQFRELLARTKATLNIYLIGERTILGEKIAL